MSAFLLNELEIRHLVVRTAVNAHPLNLAPLYWVSEPFLALLLSIISPATYGTLARAYAHASVPSSVLAFYGSDSPSILLFDAVCDVFEVPEY